MARPSGNRGMWLLKITSKHHTPERLAWAVALGVFVGLVPKVNLLAICLYALIIFLPVHTLLAIATSLLVMVGSHYLDPVTDRVGELLLTQPMLGWFWNSLDDAPVLPWLGLNNTVVLGSLVISLAMLAPVYMVCVRLFEHLEYDFGRLAGEQSYSSVPTEQTPLVAPPSVDTPPRRKQDKIKFQPQAPDENERRRDRRVDRYAVPAPGQSSGSDSQLEIHPVIVPAPKLSQRSGRSASEQMPLANLDEPIEFEPIEEVKSIINSWHMGQATGQRFKASAMATGPEPMLHSASLLPGSQQSAAPLSGSSSDAISASIGDTPKGSVANDSNKPSHGHDNQLPGNQLPGGTTQIGLVHDYYPESTWRGDVMTTLEVVQNASETLAWVDELLDECLADHGITVVASDMGHDWDRPLRSSQSQDAINDTLLSMPVDSAGESASRWLMETTIEIVRWADEGPGDPNPDLSPGGLESVSQSSFGKESSEFMQSPLATSDMSTSAAELTILPMNASLKRHSADTSSQTGFQHLVMAGSDKQPASTHKTIEPVKGECLGYLLGHLRQAREGKST